MSSGNKPGHSWTDGTENCKHCFRRAVTTYQNDLVCTKHWKLLSEADEKRAAKDVIHLGPMPVNLDDMDKEDK